LARELCGGKTLKMIGKGSSTQGRGGLEDGCKKVGDTQEETEETTVDAVQNRRDVD